jgi:rod shape-determining protein MreB
MARQPPNYAVDLGTSHTRIAARGAGVLVDVPTVVATQLTNGGRTEVVVGDEARKRLGKTSEKSRVVRPVRKGAVADFEATEQLLRVLLAQVGGTGRLRKPRLLIAIPTGLTEVERRAVMDSAKAAGAGHVSLVPSPICAAIGADLPVQDPVGSMVVDLGGGRAHVAVTSLGGMVVHRSLAVAGDDLDDAIAASLRARSGLLVGERSCETLKQRVGTLIPELHHDLQMRVRGRDLASGRPVELDVTADDVAQALGPACDSIRALVRQALADTPPELAADIVDRGMILCGGTSLLRGLDARLRDDTGLPVLQAESPTTCVIRGAARLLDDAPLLARLASSL